MDGFARALNNIRESELQKKEKMAGPVNVKVCMFVQNS
jgi:hypothetical protein